MNQHRMILAAIILVASLIWHSLAFGIRNVNVAEVSQLPVGSQGMAASGSYVYVADYNGLYYFGGIHVIDISDPEAPVELIYFEIPAWTYDVAVNGSYAYLACTWFGVNVVDISNPHAPVWISNFPTSGATGPTIYDEYLYLADNYGGLKIIDISDPMALVCVGQCATPERARNVEVYNGYAYLADYFGGLRIIDVSNPTSPFEVSYYSTFDPVEDVALSWPYAYLACIDAGLRIVDVSNPYAPVEVGHFDPWGYNYHVAVCGSFVYLANDVWGLNVVDVSIPSAPVLVGNWWSPNSSPCIVLASREWFYTNSPFQINQFTPWWMRIEMDPVSPPIQIPPGGGSFRFNISIMNNGADSSTLNAWIMQQTPSGLWQGPMLGPIDLTIPAGQGQSRLRVQNVPALAEPGVYTYRAYSGFYPLTKIDSSSFTYLKLGSGAGPSNENWTCTGELFPGEEETAPSVSASQPARCLILDANPNPFNPSTVIRYKMQDARNVSLKVYDISGRLVASLADGWQEAGEYRATFDGSGLSSGIYLARLEAGEFTTVQKLILLK